MIYVLDPWRAYSPKSGAEEESTSSCTNSPPRSPLSSIAMEGRYSLDGHGGNTHVRLRRFGRESVDYRKVRGDYASFADLLATALPALPHAALIALARELTSPTSLASSNSAMSDQRAARSRSL